MWIPGVCALLAVMVGGQPELAVILFALAAGLNTFTVSGCKVGMCDIAPDYAGIVFSVSNTISNIPGFIVPAVVGSLLTDYTDTNQWFYVFSLGLECNNAQYFILVTIVYFSCGVQIAGTLLYLIKGSATVQEWAKPKYEVENDV